MLNSQFRLLVESLGFYSVKTVKKYLNNFEAYASLNERPIEYWLKGKKINIDSVPDEVQNIFLDLKSLQKNILKREMYNLTNGKPCSFKYVYKTDLYMWNDHPELYGLPVAFLNQIVIRLDLSLDYYENHELNA